MSGVYHVLFSSAVGFLFLFIVAKIMGKKQIAQLGFVDYVIGISLGSIAAEMATDATKPFYYYMVAMAMFTLLDFALTLLERKAVFLKKIIRGKPLILINNGKIDYDTLTQSKLDTSELLSMCRGQGYFNIEDIAYCIFETSGVLSILPIAEATPVVVRDVGVSLPPSGLSCDVVVDGRIVHPALEQIGKTSDWLLAKLNIDNIEGVDNIALAYYDRATDNITVHTKN